MTWNPLKKNHLTQRPSIASPAVTEENDRELSMLYHGLHGLEESSRRLQKGMKRYLEAVGAARKSELKLSSDLSTSSACHDNDELRCLAEGYHSVNVKVFENVNELITKSQITFIEPLKKLSNVFSGVASAIHTHEQALQDWRTLAAKVRKLEEKGDRLASTIAKLDREKKALVAATENVATSHANLRHEMRVIYEMRVPYMQPSLQALTHIQLDHHGTASGCFTHLMPNVTPPANRKEEKQRQATKPTTLMPEGEYRSELHRKFSAIQALSIVKANK